MKNNAGSDQRASHPSAPIARRRSPLRTAVLAVSLVAAAVGGSSGAVFAQMAPACSVEGSWIDVKTGRSIDREDLFRDLAKTSVVLLGESHPDADHHRWQLHTLA